MKKIIGFIALALATVACVPNITVEQPKLVESPAEGGMFVVNYAASSAWSIVNGNDWFEVSPGKGDAGNVSIVVSVLENEIPEARMGIFRIVDGPSNVTYTVKQEAAVGILTDAESYSAPMTGGSFVISVFTNESFSISSDSDWITCPQDVVFEDRTAREIPLEFVAQDNTGGSPRKAYITFTSASTSKTVEVGQVSSIHKTVLGLRFTGTWCGYCPSLAVDVTKMNEEQPGRLLCICVYDSSGSTLVTPNENKMLNEFSVSGFPTIVLDSRAMFSNIGAGYNYPVLSSFCDEAQESYPAGAGVALEVTSDGSKLDVKATVSAIRKNDYVLHLYILESGIVASQADNAHVLSDPSHCVHNNVIKGFVTEYGKGESVSLDASQEKTFNYSVSMPGGIVNPQNVSVAAFLQVPSVDGPKAVKNVSYLKKPFIVDNCNVCPVNSSSPIIYE